MVNIPNGYRIKSIEYHANGLVKRVEFCGCAPIKPHAIYTLTKTTEQGETVIRKNASIKQILRPLV